MSKIWLEEAENLLRGFEQERKVLAEECEKLTSELAAQEENLAHWQAVIQSYKRRQELEAEKPSMFLLEPNLHNLSQREIVLHVRDQNGGNIPMKKVTNLLRRTVATPDHAASSAYTAIGRLMKQMKVKKVRPGLYRWVNGAA